MIRVVPKPEYPSFDSAVRKPGVAFLEVSRNPTSKDFRQKNFWNRATREVHTAYSGICAYTAMYLPEQWSIDHFFPKSVYPQLAYEWSNFRLASGRVNTSKGDQMNILDPFEVEDNWFFMDIPACLIRPNPSLEREIRTRIASTINALRLNQDDNYVQERCNILIEFAREEVSLGFLERRYPFLAKEIDRQKLDQNALRRMLSIG